MISNDRILAKHTITTMYFYTHKTNKNEQTQLLEMCINACIRFSNGFSIYSVVINTHSL